MNAQQNAPISDRFSSLCARVFSPAAAILESEKTLGTRLETFLSPEPLGLICNICLNRVGEFARHELTNLSLETLPDTLSLSLTGIRLSPKQAAERWTVTEFRRQSNSVCADSWFRINYSRNWACFDQSCVNRPETVHGTLRFLYYLTYCMEYVWKSV